MKPYHKIASIAILALTFGVTACEKKKIEAPGLTILTYSSLGGKDGFIDSVREEFLNQTQCEVRVETTMGAGQVISYLEEEKLRARVDMVMGVDELLFERAKPYLFLGSDPSLSQKYIPLIQKHVKPGFIPLDYGALTFIYRKADFKNVKMPTTLSELLKPEFKKKWIVQDPRASSSGMIFFLMAKSEGIRIAQMKSQWVTLAPSWDSSYKMFIAKDASMVWSYLTSLAYHATQGERDQYGYLDLKEGLPLQVEGMSIVNKTGDPKVANPCISKWIDFVLTPAMQSKLVAKQWMMPVMKDVPLAKIFVTLPAVQKSFPLPMRIEEVDTLISRFGLELQGE